MVLPSNDRCPLGSEIRVKKIEIDFYQATPRHCILQSPSLDSFGSFHFSMNTTVHVFFYRSEMERKARIYWLHSFNLILSPLFSFFFFLIDNSIFSIYTLTNMPILVSFMCRLSFGYPWPFTRVVVELRYLRALVW